MDFYSSSPEFCWILQGCWCFQYFYNIPNRSVCWRFRWHFRTTLEVLLWLPVFILAARIEDPSSHRPDYSIFVLQYTEQSSASTISKSVELRPSYRQVWQPLMPIIEPLDLSRRHIFGCRICWTVCAGAFVLPYHFNPALLYKGDVDVFLPVELLTNTGWGFDSWNFRLKLISSNKLCAMTGWRRISSIPADHRMCCWVAFCLP